MEDLAFLILRLLSFFFFRDGLRELTSVIMSESRESPETDAPDLLNRLDGPLEETTEDVFLRDLFCFSDTSDLIDKITIC